MSNAVRCPRSTWIHWGSAHSLAQRVDRSPSVAWSGVWPPHSWNVEAVVGFPAARFSPSTSGTVTSNERLSTPTLPWPSSAHTYNFHTPRISGAVIVIVPSPFTV